VSQQTILIFGATGPTGIQLVNQALAQGHNVTAFVRDPAKLEVSHDRLQLAEGDAQDKIAVEAAIKSRPFDAVISALGVYIKEPITPVADATQNILDTMAVQGPKRFICISSVGVGDSKGEGNWFVGLIQKIFLKYVLRDKDLQERAIVESNLDWTIIRPPQLTDDPDIHNDCLRWVGPKDKSQKVIWKVSRAGVAAECLRLVEKPDFVREAITIARKKT
jgi:putative NADH-flavin reductase